MAARESRLRPLVLRPLVGFGRSGLGVPKSSAREIARLRR
jgi:hypothetical protein